MNRKAPEGQSVHKTRFPFLPVEILAGISFIFTILLYRAFSLSLRSPWELYRTRVLGGFAWYFLGLSVALLFVRLKHLRAERIVSKRETWRQFAEEYLSVFRLMYDFRLVHVLGFTFFIFIQLKHLIPWIHPRVFDPEIYQSEISIFGGLLAAEWVLNAFGQGAASFLSAAYVSFFPYMGLLLSVLVLQRDRLLAARFALGFFLVWIFGVLLVYIFPSWGPCFFKPELFTGLPETEVSMLQKNLWKEKLFLEVSPRSLKGVFLISGFPSLHLAIVVFGSLCLRRISNLLGAISGVYAILTLLSTLYFGWHYLLDDIGGILLGAGIFRIFVTSNRLDRLKGRML